MKILSTYTIYILNALVLHITPSFCYITRVQLRKKKENTHHHPHINSLNGRIDEKGGERGVYYKGGIFITIMAYMYLIFLFLLLTIFLIVMMMGVGVCCCYSFPFYLAFWVFFMIIVVMMRTEREKTNEKQVGLSKLFLLTRVHFSCTMDVVTCCTHKTFCVPLWMNNVQELLVYTHT